MEFKDLQHGTWDNQTTESEMLRDINNAQQSEPTTTSQSQFNNNSEAGSNEAYPNEQANFQSEFHQAQHNAMPETSAEAVQTNPLAGIDADILLELGDSVIAPVGAALLSKLLKDKITKNELKLTAQQKNTLIPVLDNYLKSEKIGFKSPLEALVWTSIICYGTNALIIYMSRMKAESDAEETDLNIVAKEKVAAKRKYTRKKL